MTAPPTLSLNDWAVLGVLAEDDQHGFAVARELSVDRQVGRVWTVPRSLVYRAIDHLNAIAYLQELRTEEGDHGPRRTIVRPTPRGRAALRTWLASPVEHLRDVRSELLLKLTLLERQGTPVAELAQRQLDTFRPAFRGLATTASRHDGPDRLTDLWRAESSRSVERFLHELTRVDHAHVRRAVSPSRASPRSP